MSDKASITDLSERSREVFKLLVEAYLDTGDPVGSRTLTRAMSETVSAATVRNVMSDLEYLGLLNSPHTSAGRMPTDLGLRLFVDGFMEVADVSGEERSTIEKSVGETDEDIAATLDRAGAVLSGLTKGASLVLSPNKSDAKVKHLDFVALGPDQVLAVLVLDDGQVENRLFTPPTGLTPSAMRDAANFMNATLHGKSLTAMRNVVDQEVTNRRSELDDATRSMIDAGIAQWAKEPDGTERLIVRGRSNLISSGANEEDIERVRQLFDDLERKESLLNLLDLAETGEGVRIFIGFGKQTLFTIRFISCDFPLYECRSANRRRGWRHRSDAAKLRPGCADRRLYGAVGWQVGVGTGKEYRTMAETDRVKPAEPQQARIVRGRAACESGLRRCRRGRDQRTHRLGCRRLLRIDGRKGRA